VGPQATEAAAAFLEQTRGRVDAALDAILPPADEPPAWLHRAMRHPVFAGGKRLRPALLLAAVRSLGGDEKGALPTAAALELIHTYSLVHDDLPAMDDAAIRRGRPTCHVAFDEATAILVGDALLTLAFELAAAPGAAPAQARAEVIVELARAAGSRGMIAGQLLDLQAEGTRPEGVELERIHRLKTAALIRAAATCGGHLAGATAAEREALAAYGSSVGLAFQIVDDLLDVEGSAAVLGKSAGADAGAGKLTSPAVWGIEASRRRAAEEVERARAALAPLGRRAELLVALAAYVAGRDR